jgi:uncharacterized protein
VTDIADTEVVNLQPTNPRAGYWKFWGTALWGLAALAIFVIVGALGVFAGLVWLQPSSDLSQEDLYKVFLAHPAPLLFAPFSAAFAGLFAVLALAIRLSRVGARDYLGLKWPPARDLIIGLVGLVALYIPILLINQFAGPLHSKTYMVDTYHSAIASGLLPALAAAILIVAPISEEILFRGFLLPGWADSWLRPGGAIVLTAAIWASLHTQYDWITMLDIFGIGLLFGWIRQRSGSTLATIILHFAQNAKALAIIAIFYPSA